MFREALLESSPVMRRRNAWPMATAFTLEMIIASVLVLLPLISTLVLPTSTRVVVPVPPRYTPVETRQQPAEQGGNRNVVNILSHPVVPVGYRNLTVGRPFPGYEATDISVNPQLNLVGPGNGGVPDIINGRPIPPVQPAQPKRIIISHSLEAMLVNKVVPEYPNIARLAGVQGDVKLHAIIAKDGTIQSLVITSGPEMLREAALKAVEQWRYRPYMLNGQALEVETVITVSFRKF